MPRTKSQQRTAKATAMTVAPYNLAAGQELGKSTAESQTPEFHCQRSPFFSFRSFNRLSKATRRTEERTVPCSPIILVHVVPGSPKCEYKYIHELLMKILVVLL